MKVPVRTKPRCPLLRSTMSLRLSMTLSYEFDYTQTLFKKVEIELRKKKVRAALEHVARTKKIDAYQCLVDFLYAELFDDQTACQSYYKGKSETKLRDKLSKQQADDREAYMLDCLDLAEVLHERDLADDWNEKTDLYIWNMWHRQFHNEFGNKAWRRGRTWTAFRSLASHLKAQFGDARKKK